MARPRLRPRHLPAPAGPDRPLKPQRVSTDTPVYGTTPSARRDAGHEPNRFPAKGHINQPLWARPPAGVDDTLTTTATAAGRRLRDPREKGPRPAGRHRNPEGRLGDNPRVTKAPRGMPSPEFPRAEVLDEARVGSSGDRGCRGRGTGAGAGETADRQRQGRGGGERRSARHTGRDRRLAGGGNAFDAAVAAASVLGVVEPYSCGIGGGGFMVVRDGDSGRITTIDSREKAPGAMKPEQLLHRQQAADRRAVQRQPLQRAVAPACPGTPAAWAYVLRHYGTLTLSQALSSGVGSPPRVRGRQDLLRPDRPNLSYFDDIPSSAAIYLDSDGRRATSAP